MSQIDDNEQSHPSQARVFASKLWLIGTLFVCSRKTKLNSFYEISFGLIVAILPFFMGGVVLYVSGKAATEPHLTGMVKFFYLIKSTLDKGELLLFAISLVAPTLWLSSFEPENAKALPHRRPIIVITLLVCIFSTLLFGLTQAGVVKDPEIVYEGSLWLTVISVVNMYLTLAYHDWRLPVGKEPRVSEEFLRKNSNDFLDAILNPKSKK